MKQHEFDNAKLCIWLTGEPIINKKPDMFRIWADVLKHLALWLGISIICLVAWIGAAWALRNFIYGLLGKALQ